MYFKKRRELIFNKLNWFDMNLLSHSLFNLLQLISRLDADFAGKTRTKADVRKGVLKDAASVQERAEMVLKAAKREATMSKLSSASWIVLAFKALLMFTIYCRK